MYIFQCVHNMLFHNHNSLGRSSGELAGSKKERRRRQLVRRHRWTPEADHSSFSHCGPPSWGHRECSRFLPGPGFRRFLGGRQGLHFRQQPTGPQSLSRRSPCQRIFRDVCLLLLLPTPRTYSRPSGSWSSRSIFQSAFLGARTGSSSSSWA